MVLLGGHGIAHPMRMRIASHLAFFLDFPTVGCAKNLLIGEFNPPNKTRGSYSILRIGEDKVGWVLITRNNVKPIFLANRVRRKVSVPD